MRRGAYACGAARRCPRCCRNRRRRSASPGRPTRAWWTVRVVRGLRSPPRRNTRIPTTRIRMRRRPLTSARFRVAEVPFRNEISDRSSDDAESAEDDGATTAVWPCGARRPSWWWWWHQPLRWVRVGRTSSGWVRRRKNTPVSRDKQLHTAYHRRFDAPATAHAPPVLRSAPRLVVVQSARWSSYSWW